MFQSIVLTIHNKAWLIPRVVSSILNYTTAPYELILVFDGCTDSSEKVAIESIGQRKISYKTIHTPDVYETKANNAGIKEASGEQIIIVQDDMVVNEIGWNTRLAKPLKSFSDVFAVTAKTTHNFVFNFESEHYDMSEDLDNCWCDMLDYDSVMNRENGLQRDDFVIRHSVNRGPLLLDHEKLEKLNFFDEIFAPQSMDDHDLCYRAYKQFGWLAGAYWIDFLNDPEWSSTKSHDDSRVPPWFYEAHHKNSKIIWERHKEVILFDNHNEIRKLP